MWIVSNFLFFGLVFLIYRYLSESGEVIVGGIYRSVLRFCFNRSVLLVRSWDVFSKGWSIFYGRVCLF